MTPFLQQIARHYLASAEHIDKLVFVFPSQRAVVFFRKYLSAAVAESGHVGIHAPKMLSMDEFLGSFSSCRNADRLTLILLLYDCYVKACSHSGVEAESLDKFIFWGGVILSDFDDVDKYLVDAKDIFRNVSELKNLTDDFSYLSETQREAMNAFLGHFNGRGEFKMRFARLWNILWQLYTDLGEALDKRHLTYTGKQYRSILDAMNSRGAEQVLREAFPECEKVVFCGLNALCECERRILGKLRDLSLSDFCWDYSSAWIKDPRNKSSFFMKDNVQAFPQAFPLDSCTCPPSFEVVSVPSGIGQTKLMSSLLNSPEVAPDENTAVVLPDETLLQPLLNSIPDRVRQVNVTMGYSIGCSSFFTLMSDIAQLQLRLRTKDGRSLFYHRPLWNIVSNNVFDAVCDEPARAILQGVKSQLNYYVDAQALKGSEFLELVFTPVVKDVRAADSAQIRSIEEYQLKILDYIGRKIASDDALRQNFSLELDFAMEYVKGINLLSDKELPVLPQTYFSLLENALRAKSIPLKGEPLTGLQIMGPLETRALDFDKVFILSSNEGVFPRSNVGASFIPAQLRKGFGLPTYEYQDAVWAYYFYRLVQRSSKVWMLLDSRSEGLHSGEESRYIKQLQYHFKADLRRRRANAFASSSTSDDVVAKTAQHVRIIHSHALSPTSLQTYLSCSMKFYYSFVLGMRSDDDVAETMDASVIGNVYHAVMQYIYEGCKQGIVTREYLCLLSADKDWVRGKVEAEIRRQMHTDEITGRDIVISTVICKYVLKTLQRDIEFLDEAKADRFNIIALEKDFRASFGGFSFKGRVDRLDSFHPGVVRLVDYKTGKVLDTDTDISDATAEKIAGAIFSDDNSLRPKIALQFFIYDLLLEKSGAFSGQTIVNTVYSTRSLLQKRPVNVYMNAKFHTLMKEKLTALLSEIDSLEIPFRRHVLSYNDHTCEMCDFRTICGR